MALSQLFRTTFQSKNVTACHRLLKTNLLYLRTCHGVTVLFGEGGLEHIVVPFSCCEQSIDRRLARLKGILGGMGPVVLSKLMGKMPGEKP